MTVVFLWNYQKYSTGNSKAFSEIRKKDEYKFNQLCACISKRMRKGEGLNYKARRYKFEIGVNFKQILIFIKYFQNSTELRHACNEKALFTTEE